MKAPSTISIPWTLNWLIFCFTFFPFVWLVMACVTTPISNRLRISRLSDGDDDVWIDLGVFGGCAEDLNAGRQYALSGVDCSSQTLGYSVLGSAPDASSTRFELLTRDDTYPMILVPIATAFAGYSCVLILFAWWGGGKRWARLLDMGNMGFHWACTIITWVAFGFCIRLSQILRDRLDMFANDPDLAPRVRYGNAVWLILVAALLMLIASVLYTVKQYWPPAKVKPAYERRNKDVEMDGKRSPRQQPYVGMIGG